MGMYTGLRCKIIAKKEYIEDIKELLTKSEWRKCSNSLFKNFGDISRADCIPYGSLSYMPDCWEESNGNNSENWWENLKDANGFDLAFYPETGLWCFQCSLKNYESTIEYFIDNILNEITEKIIHLEYLYEESDVSTLYEINGNDGKSKIKPLDYGIRYQVNDEYYELYKQKGDGKEKNIEFADYDFTKESRFRTGGSI